MPMQAKLLRVLQDRTFERLGSVKAQRADVRVICATHRNLAEMVDAGTFREDLFYRVRVVPVQLPPLRERAGDIPLIANSILQRISERSQKELHGIDRDALETLDHYAWLCQRTLTSCTLTFAVEHFAAFLILGQDGREA